MQGFKSVFKVADVVSISSKEYTFKFDKREELGMVIPIWANQCPGYAGWTTFTLELSANTAVEALSAHLSEIRPSLLLFLRKLRQITVQVDGVRSQFDCSYLNDEQNIARLARSQGGQVTNNDYLIVKKKTNTFAQEPKREGVTESEIVLAFPLSSERTPIIQDQAVHAFLPIRTQNIPVSPRPFEGSP